MSLYGIWSVLWKREHKRDGRTTKTGPGTSIFQRRPQNCPTTKSMGIAELQKIQIEHEPWIHWKKGKVKGKYSD